MTLDINYIYLFEEIANDEILYIYILSDFMVILLSTDQRRIFAATYALEDLEDLILTFPNKTGCIAPRL